MSQPRVVCLSPSYQPYRVPVWDEMDRKLGNRFILMALSRQPSTNDRLALTMGDFNRKIVPGGYLSLSRKQMEGMETPAHLILSPTFPYDLAKLRPDVVITNNFSTWTMTTIALGYRTVLFWEGTKHTERTIGAIRKKTREWIVNRTPAFVTCGPMSRDYLVDELGVPSERIWIGGTAPLPAPPEFREVGPRVVKNGESVKFLFSGQLIGRKGPQHLLDAVARLRNRFSNDRRFEVRIAGQGPQQELLQRRARDLGIEDVVSFLGFVPLEEIWTLYEQNHVFVLPTLQDNWPLVVPEAMQIGMPILLSRYAGSTPEFIEEDGNGYTFDPTDPEMLADRMSGYISHPDRVRRHGERSLRIVSTYTPEWAANAFIEAAEFVAQES
jgi:glycosyltransferase involved in cell wall biosynthesis